MNATDLELIVLDSLLSDELACEFRHQRTTCTGRVTHRVLTCHECPNICEHAAAAVRQSMAEGKTHSACHRLAAACWKVLPV